MPGSFIFHYDLISFWLGFLMATLLWLVINRFKRFLPSLIQRFRNRAVRKQRSGEDQLDEYLRQETWRRAQSMHLASPLFALDDILIEPALLAPPPAFISPGVATPDTLANQVIPYLPDWPELTAQYHVATLTPAQAIQNGARVSVIGRPGCGKTITLAHLASQIAHRDESTNDINHLTPLLMHVLEWSLTPSSLDDDPIKPLIKAVSAQCKAFVQPKIPNFIKTYANNGNLLLLLDGLDELSPAELQIAVQFLTTLLKQYPKLSVITTASSEYFDGLGQIGFLPLAVAAWNTRQKEQYLQQWSCQWASKIAPELLKQTSQEAVDERILNLWLASDDKTLTPLEWTLKAWGLFSGDLCGPRGQDAIDTYLHRVTHDILPEEALPALAYEWIRQDRCELPYSELESFLSKLRLPVVAEEPSNLPEKTSMKVGMFKTGKKGEKKVSSSAQAINTLLEYGVLVEHNGGQIRFASPIFVGFLAAKAIPQEHTPFLLAHPIWSLKEQTGNYLAASGQAEPLIEALLSLEEGPLYANLLIAARWLKDAPTNANWRPFILRRLVNMAQLVDLPIGLRGRFFGALISANDPSMALLFKQLTKSESREVRQLAVLGCGELHQSRLLDDVMALLADPEPDVRIAACLALSAFDFHLTEEAISTALVNGDEGLQMAAAEVLAGSPEGYQSLRDALGFDDLLVRRAAVSGISHIHESWASELIEKIAIEDGQWAVRNLALQAVQNRKEMDPYIPIPLPVANDAAWLITFASNQGVGVPTEGQPVDLFLMALETGTLDEKLASLASLHMIPEKRVMDAIIPLTISNQSLLREAAFYTLWQFSLSGLELPPLSKVGQN